MSRPDRSPVPASHPPGGPREALLAALLLGSGCAYDFRNPAEQLRTGEVDGRVVAERPGSPGLFDPQAGVAVGLRNCGLVEVSRPSGRFVYLDLPVGRHMLLFRQGADRLLEREVEVALGRDGQPEGVSLGDVPILFTVTVGGLVQPPPADVAASVMLTSCLVVDEVSGLTTRCHGAASGQLAWTFPGLAVGQHRLRFEATTSNAQERFGGVLEVDLADADQRTTKQLSPVTLHPPSGQGTIRLQVAGITEQAAALTAASVPAGVSVVGLPPGVVPDSTGLIFAQVPEGLYQIGLASAAGGLTLPPAIPAVVLAGQVTDLGNVYAIADAVAQRTQLDCRGDADCAPGTCLAAGLCDASFKPALAVGPWVALCDTSGPNLCGPPTGALCGQRGIPAACVADGGAALCVICGGCCTPDGAALLCSSAGIPPC